MKQNYQTPSAWMEYFSESDILTASGGDRLSLEDGGNGDFIIWDKNKVIHP